MRSIMYPFIFLLLLVLVFVLVVTDIRNREEEKEGQFLLNHHCSRINLDTTTLPTYQCDNGNWEERDILLMIKVTA